MLGRSLIALATALVLVASTAQAAVTNYAQNFESMSLADPSALSNDGWLVYGNVWAPDKTTYLYGYGPYPAPNPGGGFSALVADQGGVPQGTIQLSVYNDYNNQDHGLGRWIEANVYREQTIAAGDVGRYMTFAFDAKMGNLELLSTAGANARRVTNVFPSPRTSSSGRPPVAAPAAFMRGGTRAENTLFACRT